MKTQSFFRCLFLAAALLGSLSLYPMAADRYGIEYRYIDGTDNKHAVAAQGRTDFFGHIQLIDNLGGYTPSYVKKIDENAFINCTGILSVRIPVGIDSIGVKAFSGCAGLKEVAIPDDFLYNEFVSERPVAIGEQAFEGCSVLKSITLGYYVASIAANAFAGCAAISEVYCYGTQPPLADAAAFGALDLSTIALYVPEGALDAYKEDAFWGQFGSIGERKEFALNGLKYRTINDKTAEVVSFANESSHSSTITVPSSVSFEAKQYAVVKIADRAFYSNEQITSVTLNEGLKQIGSEAFAYSMALASVKLPDSLEDIGWSAFRSCMGLKTLEGGSGVVWVSSYAFERCSKLEAVTFSDNLRYITDNAFQECSALTSVTLGDGLEVVGNKVFLSCKKLTSVHLGENLCSIGEGAFSATSLSGELSFGKKMTTIGLGAFRNCKITSLILPDNITSLGVYAFSECPELESVQLNLKIEEIPGGLFYRCEKLKAIVLNEGITTIGGSAFYGCTSLSMVDLPASLTTINRLAFSFCESLITIYSRNATPPDLSSEGSVFGGVPKSVCIVYVPESAIAAYTAPHLLEWPDFNYRLLLSDNATAAQAIRAYVQNGQLVVNNSGVPVAVSVYTVLGVQIGAFIADGADSRLQLPEKGIYLVEANGKAEQVVY